MFIAKQCKGKFKIHSIPELKTGHRINFVLTDIMFFSGVGCNKVLYFVMG